MLALRVRLRTLDSEAGVRVVVVIGYGGGGRSRRSVPRAGRLGRWLVDIDAEHFELVAAEIADGAVVPFLGAGANLCDRPAKVPWAPGRFAPSGRELAKALAVQSRYPNLDDLDDLDRQPDLQWISQYFDAVLGDRRLYMKIREVFEAQYPPSSLHRLLAHIPALLRERGTE